MRTDNAFERVAGFPQSGFAPSWIEPDRGEAFLYNARHAPLQHSRLGSTSIRE
jgi:hypothetical protein